MKPRSLEPEILDKQRPPRAELESTVAFLSWINRRLGGVRAMQKAFENIAWSGTLKVLDVATGDADVPRALVEWARRAGRKMEFTALDLEGDMLELAREKSQGYPEIAFARGDVRSMSFDAGSFDFVTSTLFFHHLPDDAVVEALKSFARIARRGIVVNDLLRRRRLYWWTKFFTLFGNDIVRYDGPLSVRKSFTQPEIETLVARAGLPWLKARAVFGHRFVLAGEKPTATHAG